MDYIFNNQGFDIEIILYNGKNKLSLTKNAFRELTFIEDLFDWPTKGYIVLDNQYEFFRRLPDLATGENPNAFYKFLGNGKDLIKIMIHPKKLEDRIAGEANFDLPFAFDKWGIEFEAIIYDVEDLDSDSINSKLIKLFFAEKPYFDMLNRNVEFSTTEKATEGKSIEEIIQMTNTERALKTGDCIYEFLKKNELEKFLQNYGTEKWSEGDEKNKIFYTSPSSQKAIQDLSYLLSLHTADEAHKFEPCFFKYERALMRGEPKQFSLMPISEYFKKAGKDSPGEYATDHFFIQNVAQTEQTAIEISKAPESGFNFNNDVKAIEFSDIKTYKFLENQATTNIDLFANIFNISFNNIDGQFNFEKIENTAEEVRTFIKDNYIKELKTSGNNDARITLNKEIKDGTNSKIQYTNIKTREGRYAVGRNRLILNQLFNSIGISFPAKGMTIRQPARFFSVSKKGEINDKDFDHRIEGQYLATNIQHTFKTDESNYYNKITGVKCHVWMDAWPLDENAENSLIGANSPLDAGFAPVNNVA